ncbi:cyclic GMP-AMP synthase DncV-like nucleotidyltransferase [Pseudomonas sp.]|uniref:SMODS domain-containing nucleotidyltransferase n=1 Tax=Pseudomonas sp. TaxID=306 RepID=UPI002734879F|nr:hypothetical protein [Pseudomonas sp.]MDP2747571.1 hypothetical protein [Pseudomonas sp.]
MKLVSQFNDFLKDTVNLNQSRFDQLESSIDAVQRYLLNADWKPKIIRYAAHGSWAHKTIIRPIDGASFDADLLVYIDHVEDWEPKQYINTLHEAFRASATYAGKVIKSSHCVTIEYAGERKIDIAPCIKDRRFTDEYEVCNRNSNEFEPSRPGDYTDWLIAKNTSSSKNNLRKVTRLLKYLRDIKTTFTCPSFLLTTMLGERILANDGSRLEFSDVPSALKEIVGRLDDWLQANYYLPEVHNPVLWSEIQSRCWDQAKYSNFRNVINRYRDWIDEAYDEEDKDESIAKWRRVFGDEFAKAEAVEKAARVSPVAIAALESLASSWSDMVSAVKAIGRSALPENFTKLPHMERPKWRNANSAPINVRIKTYRAESERSIRQAEVQSLTPLRPGIWLEFNALSLAGLPFPRDYSVKWRITNTDAAAYAAKCMRGQFYSSETHGVRREYLEYHGVHMVEAYVIKRSDESVVGRSDIFYVVID